MVDLFIVPQTFDSPSLGNKYIQARLYFTRTTVCRNLDSHRDRLNYPVYTEVMACKTDKWMCLMNHLNTSL
jgi:hypothetical protein